MSPTPTPEPPAGEGEKLQWTRDGSVTTAQGVAKYFVSTIGVLNLQIGKVFIEAGNHYSVEMAQARAQIIEDEFALRQSQLATARQLLSVNATLAVDRAGEIERMRTLTKKLGESLGLMNEVFDSDTARRYYSEISGEGWTMLEIDACLQSREALTAFREFEGEK